MDFLKRCLRLRHLLDGISDPLNLLYNIIFVRSAFGECGFFVELRSQKDSSVQDRTRALKLMLVFI